MDFTERKAKLIEENEWIPQAIESISNRLLDKGFNICGDWLGYHDAYVLHYVPHTYYNREGEEVCSQQGELEIHTKEEVFNPYKYCNGKGYEYEKIAEFSILESQVEILKKYLYLTGREIDGKKVSFENPYPRQRVEFYQGSDVPINGDYE